jgi:hypothetical protein
MTKTDIDPAVKVFLNTGGIPVELHSKPGPEGIYLVNKLRQLKRSKYTWQRTNYVECGRTSCFQEQLEIYD